MKSGMATTELGLPRKEIAWTSPLIRRLRGKRTQAEFGALLGAPKNTVWRWEAGYSAPDAEYARRLSKLAARERFLKDWKLVGSVIGLGDIEEASRQTSRVFQESLARSARELTE